MFQGFCFISIINGETVLHLVFTLIWIIKARRLRVIGIKELVTRCGKIEIQLRVFCNSPIFQ